MTSEKWAGFTDEDIERIKLNHNSISPDKMCEVEGFISTSKNRGPMKIIASSKYKKNGESTKYKEIDSLSDDSKAQKEFVLPNQKQASFESSEEKMKQQIEDNCTCNNYVIEENKLTSEVNAPDDYYKENKLKCQEVDESCANNLLPLEIIEMRQKRIEAENTRRRELINKAINDKKKHTHAEAVKLAKITQELNHIDSNLSSDISILRNYIEKASQEFSEAEKRYLKAEKEFVEAKLVLFDKMQRKEMLTEHLCAIIEQNENRKADKLVELMKQLEMEVNLDECEVNKSTLPILPNLCALNDEHYHTCQTLRPPLLTTHSLEKHINVTNEAFEKKTKMDDLSTQQTKELLESEDN